MSLQRLSRHALPPHTRSDSKSSNSLSSDTGTELREGRLEPGSQGVSVGVLASGDGGGEAARFTATQ